MHQIKSLTSTSFLILFVLFLIESGCGRKSVSQRGSSTKAKSKSDLYSEDLTAFRPQYKMEEDDSTPNQSATAAQRNVAPTRDVTAKLDTLMSSIAQYNRNIRYAQGYRIQVYSGNSREEASKARDRSYALFPDITPHIIYNQPTFRVKVGDFVDRLEAQNFYAGLITDFPNAMIVQDKIEIK